MSIIHTEHLELIPASVKFIELLIANEYQQAGRLLNIIVPHGWPHDDDARAGLHFHLQAILEDERELLWRIRLIVLAESKEVIGSINIKGLPTQSGEVEIGWGIVAEQRGRGYAVEAARGAIEWVYTAGEVRRVVATIEEDNLASQKVAERLGMRRTGEKKRGLPVWELMREDFSISVGRS